MDAGQARCTKCGETKPTTNEHWYFEPGGRMTRPCRECDRRAERTRLGLMETTEAERAAVSDALAKVRRLTGRG